MMKMRLRIVLGLMFLFIGLGACRPIEGLDRDQDEVEEVIEEVEPIKEEPVESLPIEVEEEPVVEEEVVIEANYLRVEADALNVRREATVDSEILTKIYDQQIYPIMDSSLDGEGMAWYQVEAADDFVGWVSGDYCVIAETYQELVIEEDVE